MMTDEIAFWDDIELWPEEKCLMTNEYKWGGMHIMGKDRWGRSLIYIIPRVHNPSARNLEHCTQLFLYTVRTALEASSEENVVMLMDLTGWGLKNRDNQLLNMWIHTLQNNFPERLGHCFVCNYPWVMWAVYKVASLWLDERTKKKIHFITDLSELRKCVDEKNLSVPLGGTMVLPEPEIESTRSPSGMTWFGWFRSAAKPEEEEKLSPEEEARRLTELEKIELENAMKETAAMEEAEKVAAARRRNRKRKTKNRRRKK